MGVLGTSSFFFYKNDYHTVYVDCRIRLNRVWEKVRCILYYLVYVYYTGIMLVTTK